MGQFVTDHPFITLLAIFAAWDVLDTLARAALAAAKKNRD
jgi:hypothetical protein